MSQLLEKAKRELLQARKNKDIITRDILTVVIGGVQQLTKPSIEDRDVISVIQKLIKSNNECLTVIEPATDLYQKLDIENKVLNSLLPKFLTVEEIMAEFLNSSNPEFEQIRNANTEGAAMGFAMKFCKGLALNVRPEDVKQVVRNIRDS